MKKNKKAFETSFWAGFVTKNPFKAVDAFFAFEHLNYYKTNLNEAIIYSYKRKVYKQENPSNVFVFYTAVRSFLKVCYCLQEKSKKWKITASFRSETVFQKAFDEKTLEEFEFFLSEIVRLSLSPHAGDPDSDLTASYIHLMKILDAVELLRERGVEKIKKTDQIDAVGE